MLIKFISLLFLLLAFAFSAGAEQFTQINSSLPAPPRPSVAWADYDNDGDLDLLISGEGSRHTITTRIYNNNGGVFTDSEVILNPLQLATAAWGDFDNDGDLDLAMTGETSTGAKATYVYRNNGGSFTALPISFVGMEAGSLVWVDYDNDGDLDLFMNGITGSTVSSALTLLYRNDGNGSFVSVAHPFGRSYLGSVAWGDYDNDGDVDVVIAGSSETGALVAGIWRNDGKGNFTHTDTDLPGTDLGFARWGDYDGDGDLDLLFGGNSNEGVITRIYRNDDGEFVDIGANLLPLLWSNADWGDFDNDGDLDFILIGYDPVAGVTQSKLYRNDGGGVFTETTDSFITAYLGTVSWADYDNDGDLDLLIAGNGSNNLGDKLRIYRNDSNVTNTAPTVPIGLHADVLGTHVTLSWEPANDGQTPSASLTYNVRVGTTPGGSEIVAPQSSGDGLPQIGNSQLGLLHRLRNLTPGITYYWSVQAVDSALNASTYAVEGTFTATVDTPELQLFQHQPDGTIRQTWLGTPGITYRIEASDDLQNWTVVATPVAATGTGAIEFVDESAAAVPSRYYHVALP